MIIFMPLSSKTKSSCSILSANSITYASPEHPVVFTPNLRPIPLPRLERCLCACSAADLVTDIDIFNYTTDDYKTADYTIHFENVETQAQKVLLMQNNGSVYTNEFAVMYSGSGPIVSVGSSVDGNNIRLLATPETGISGLTTYRWTKHVQK